MDMSPDEPRGVILSSIKIWMMIVIAGGLLGNIVVILSSAPAIVSQIIFQTVGIVILVVVLRNYSFNGHYHDEDEKPLKLVMIGIAFWLLSDGILFPIGNFILWIVHFFEQKTVSSYTGLVNDRLEAYLFLFSFVILAPVFEELMFRKYVMGRLLQTNLNHQLVLLVSTFIFAIIHTFADIRYGTVGFAFYHFVIVFGGGWALGAIYIKSRNIMYPILIHGLGNLYGSLEGIFEIVYPPLVPGIRQFNQFYSWGCLIFSVIMLLLYRGRVIKLTQKYTENFYEIITQKTELLIVPVVGFLLIELLFLELSRVLPIAQGSFLSTLFVSVGYGVSFFITYVLTRSAIEVKET